MMGPLWRDGVQTCVTCIGSRIAVHDYRVAHHLVYANGSPPRVADFKHSGPRLRAWRDHPTQLVEKIAGWSIIARKSVQPDLKRPINRLPQVQHLPPNHANKHHQQDGERDIDPLSHGGSMACSPAEIEGTCG
jgi:hypothetical protein